MPQSPFETSGPTPDLVVLAPGDQASLPLRYSSAPVGEASPYCPPPLSARVLLPVDDEPVTAALASGEPMPPLCGEEVRVGPWRFGYRLTCPRARRW